MSCRINGVCLVYATESLVKWKYSPQDVIKFCIKCHLADRNVYAAEYAGPARHCINFSDKSPLMENVFSFWEARIPRRGAWVCLNVLRKVPCEVLSVPRNNAYI